MIKWLIKRKFLIGIIVMVLIVVFFAYRSLGKTEETQYVTSTVERGMIVSSITASGSVTNANMVSITTQASGTINKLYVQEGDVVKAGDRIASITLDSTGRVNKAKAWASYLAAKSSLESSTGDELTNQKNINQAKIELVNARESKLSAQRELKLAKSSLIAAQDAYAIAKNKPQNDAERKQKELALEAAQKSLDLAERKLDVLTDNSEQSLYESDLLLEQQLNSAKATLLAVQADYDAAEEDTATTDSELERKQLALDSAELAVTLAQTKVDNAGNSSGITYQQNRISAQKELDLAKSSLIAAQDAWDSVKNLPQSNADRQQKELALQASEDALSLAENKLNNIDMSIAQANLGVAIAQKNAQSSNSSAAQARANMEAALLSYEQTLPTVTAPIDGTITDLSLLVGMTISGSSSSSSSNSSSSSSGSGGNSSGTSSGSGNSSSGSSQKICTIINNNIPLAQLSVSEIDIPKIKIGQKATITMDAFSGKTFTGKVIGINRTGSTSSNVTTYPVTVQFDEKNNQVQPNMAASVSIIVETKDDVLLIPTGASKTSNDLSTVTILKNGQPQTISVELGLTSDTQVEVISGVSEGDQVVTQTILPSSQQTSSSSSAFSGSNRGFGSSSGTNRNSSGNRSFGGISGGPPGMMIR